MEHSLLQERMLQDLNSGGMGGLGHEDPEAQPSEEELELQEAVNQEALREQDAALAQVTNGEPFLGSGFRAWMHLPLDMASMLWNEAIAVSVFEEIMQWWLHT